MIRTLLPIPLTLGLLIGMYEVFRPAEPDSLGPPRVVVLGVDGLDPDLLRRFVAEDHLPHFARLMAEGHWSPLGTTIPPESPVAWSTFLTGRNPGEHGVFGFIHADPATYQPVSATTKVAEGSWIIPFGDWQLPLSPPSFEPIRSTPSFLSAIREAGHPVVGIRVPTAFPAQAEEGRILAGMGVPDLAGTFGESSFFTTDPEQISAHGTATGRQKQVALMDGVLTENLLGPANPLRVDGRRMEAPLTVRLWPQEQAALITVGAERILLRVGEWSDWVSVSFTPHPWVPTVRGMVRFYLRETHPHFGLYVSPVNIDPAYPATEIASSGSLRTQLYRRLGRFHTQGLAEDTQALDSGALRDSEFLAQAHQVYQERVAMIETALDQAPDGLVFLYVSSIDLLCHMYWRTLVEDHPAPPAELEADSAHPILDIYQKVDQLLGEIRSRIPEDTTLVVLSDHGFGNYQRNFDLNAWLLAEGYLRLRPGAGLAAARGSEAVDWSKTQAFGRGFCGLYLNRSDRFAQGWLEASAAKDLATEIQSKLLALRDPETGQQVVERVYRGAEVYAGQAADRAPDLVLGLARGYRNSPTSALGLVGTSTWSDNEARWSGTHLNAAHLVPGILLTNQALRPGDSPELIDLAPTLLAQFGLHKPELEGQVLFGEE